MDRLYNRAGLYLAIMLSLSGANVLAVGTAVDQTSLLFPSVKVNQTNIGGLTIDAARNAIATNNAVQIQHAAVDVFYADRHWLLHATDIDLSLDDKLTAQIAFAKPRAGNLLQRFTALHNTHDIHPVIQLNADKLDNWLKSTARQIDTPAIPAAIEEAGSSIIITPETQGAELDQINSAHAITNAILSGKTSVDLIVRTIQPDISESDLKHINGILASYQTRFNPDETARTQNIALTIRALNGILLKPGDILSFNSVVGPRTQQRGYLKAPAYVNDDALTEDWGGGICQASTTLYNTALLANLTVIERSPHYRPVGYVPIGLDAAVDFDSNLDLKIKNTLPYSVYISTAIDKESVHVRIYGKVSSENPEIQLATTSLTTIEPATTIIQDPNLTAGKQVVIREGQSGFQVTTARVRRENGKEYREILADDIYKAVNKLVRVGSKTNDVTK